MNNLEFAFDAAPWELLLDKAEDTVSALELLTALEGVGEDEYEEALALLVDTCRYKIKRGIQKL